MILALLAVVLLASCGGMQGKSKKPESLAFKASQLTTAMDKHEVVIEDLSKRITELENLIIQQQHEMKKLKKIVKKHNMQPTTLVEYESQNTTNEEGYASGPEEESYASSSAGYYDYQSDYGAEEEEGEEEEYTFTTSNYAKPNNKKKSNEKRPLLKIHGSSSPAAPASSTSSVKVADASSLLKDAAVAANYVPMKLAPLAMGDGEDSLSSPGESMVEEEPPIEKKPINPYEVAVLKYKEGKWKDAALYFDIFLKKDPTSLKCPNALFLKGESLYQSGKTIEALGTFEQVETKFPKWSRIPETKFRIGMCYEKMKDMDKAKSIYEGVVAAFPKSNTALKALVRIKALEK
ncbi:MAG: tetratricopeptide repeat protein [Pseudomonadota bacterium]